MAKKTQVQVKSLAINAANISHSTIDGVDHITIKGVVPIVDDIVMNGGLYPASEINSSYQSIEGNLMPMTHPQIDGQHVSAHNPRAVNKFHVGAWAENVRKDGDRVVMDMKVNTQTAGATEQGQRLLDRLAAMEANGDSDPIHISTGLLLNRTQNTGKSRGKKYTWVASNMAFDHVAILLDEPGAGTPKDGVGIFCNADDSTEEMDILRVNLSDSADGITETWKHKLKMFFNAAGKWSFDDISSAIYNKLQAVYPNDDFIYPTVIYSDSFIYARNDKFFQQQYTINDDGECVFSGDPVEVERTPVTYQPVTTNGEHDQMKQMIVNALKEAGKPVDGLTDEQLFAAFSALNAEKKPAEPKKDANGNELDEEGNPIKAPAKTTAANADEVPAWAKALTERFDRLEQAQNSGKEAKLKEQRDTVKAAFGLTDAAVNAMGEEALSEMAANAQGTMGINASFTGGHQTADICNQPE